MAHPVAIGGVGGSGTRLGARLLEIFGYYIGDDLNEPLDNLWFTLLFKRRAILTSGDAEMARLASLFFGRLIGTPNLGLQDGSYLEALACDGRLQHDGDWLRARAASFLNHATSRRDGQPWGWKEPNTHIVIERLQDVEPRLRYLHFVRHPLDMAFSANQNQLENWGPVMLSRDVRIEPRESLSYWCAAQRRIEASARERPDRMILVSYETLCADPASECARIARFLDVAIETSHATTMSDLVAAQVPTSGRYRSADLSLFRPEDLQYVVEAGFRI